MAIKRRAYGAVRWTSVSTTIRVAMQIVQLIVVARFVSPSDFGTMAIISGIVSFVQIFSDLGISSTIIYTKEIDKKVLSTLYWINIIIGIFLTAILIGSATLIASFYGNDALKMPIMVIALSFVLSGIGMQYKALSEKYFFFKRIAIVEMVGNIIASTTTMVLAFLGFGLWSLVAYTVLVVGLTGILYRLFLVPGYNPEFAFSWREAWAHVKDGSMLVISSLLSTIALQADILLAGRIFGANLLGLYSMPKDLCLKIMYATNPIITRIGTPLISEYQKDVDVLRRIHLMSIRMTSSVNFPIYGAMITFRHELISVVFGQNWVNAADMLVILPIYGMFRSLLNPISIIFLGTGNVGVFSKMNIITSTITFIVLFLTVKYGILWMSIASTVLYVIFSVMSWYFVKNISGVEFVDYVKQWAIPLFVVVISCMGSRICAEIGVSDVWRLIVGLISGSIFYVFVSRFLNRAWYDSMFELINLKK